MELKEKVVKGVFWSGAQTWGARAVSFVVFALLSRQRAELQRSHLDTAFWTNMIFGVTMTLVSIGASGLIAGLFDEPDLAEIVRWLSPVFIFAGLSGVQQAILKRELAFKKLALREILAIVAGGIVGVVLAFLGFGVWSLVAQTLTKRLVGVVVLWGVSDWRPSFRFSKKHFTELFSFGLNIIGTNVLNFLNGHADDLLIGYFLGSTQLGLYTVAYRLFGMTKSLLTSVIMSVTFPTFSRLQDDLERLRRIFYQALFYTSLMAFPVFLGILVTAPELIPVLFGPQWADSIPVLRVLTFIGILHSIQYFHGSVIVALGKPSWRLGMIFLNAVTNVIAFAIAVRWGIVAVAAAYVIRGYLLAPIGIWMVKKLAKIDLKIYFRQFLMPLLGSLAMVVVVLGLKYLIGNALGLEMQLVIYVLVGGLSYVLVMQLMEPSLKPQLLKLIQLAIPERYSSRIWRR